MSQIPCPKCGRELIRPNPDSLLSTCRCGFSGCMRDDIAAEYRDEIEAEKSELPVVEQETDIKQSIGDKPCSSMSIDRIENHKGYEPGNVRWATAKVQVQNRRCTLYLTIGQETKTLKEWSAFSGTNYNTMLTRLVRGGLSHREIVYGRGAK